MIALDENVPESQRQLLRGWRIRAQQIGHEFGRQGMTDAEIIPLLHQYPGTTFFTRDEDFYRRQLCHPSYCLVWLVVGQYEVASFIRRFLHLPFFNTRRKRGGSVVRASHVGLRIWRLHAEQEVELGWASVR